MKLCLDGAIDIVEIFSIYVEIDQIKDKLHVIEQKEHV
jgi:hypothetical protein